MVIAELNLEGAVEDRMVKKNWKRNSLEKELQVEKHGSVRELQNLGNDRRKTEEICLRSKLGNNLILIEWSIAAGF